MTNAVVSRGEGGGSFRVALLMCDTPVPAVVQADGTYLDIFYALLKRSCPDQRLQFTLDAFDVVASKDYLTNSDLNQGAYKGILISGSKYSAYDDVDWITNLVNWTADISQRTPDVKIIGICFGHQIIARAFGGTCLPNERGWEVGTTEFDLTAAGREVFKTNEKALRIQQMHRDIVPSVPPTFENLGLSPVCAVQGMVKRYPTPRDNEFHILTVQGHPEFTSDIVNKIVDVREKSGAMSDDVVKEGRRRAIIRHDGEGAIGQAMWRMLGVVAEHGLSCIS